MDKNKQNKPRTIQMKYPAQYSQSWPENQKSGASKKKLKVHDTSLSGHAPPHFQSWPNDRNTKRVKRKPISPKVAAQKLNLDPFSRGPWQPGKPKFRGPDPTVPHLKYGLFPPPKKNANKSQMQVMSPSGPEPKSRTSTPEHSSKKDKKLKAKKGQMPEGEPPMFVFRAIDPRYTRQLSVSAPTHVDIRPRNRTAGQLYAPAVSPPLTSGRAAVTIKNSTPTQSNTPLKKTFHMLPKKNIT